MKNFYKSITAILILPVALLLTGFTDPTSGSAGSTNSSEKSKPKVGVDNSYEILTPKRVNINLENSNLPYYVLGGNSMSKNKGDGIVISIISDGVDETDKEIAGKVLPNYSMKKNKVLPSKSFVGFGSGAQEGTFAAGILLPAKDGKGLIGLTPNSKVLPVILPIDNTLSDKLIADAINYSVKKGSNIITLPLGITQDLILGRADKTCQAITQAKSKNVFVLVSSYNEESINKPEFDPTECKDAIKISAVDEYFKTIQGASPVNGADFSVYSTGITSLQPADQWLPYTTYSSSDMAQILMAGSISLLMSDGLRNYESVLTRLKNGSIDLGLKSYFGYGLINTGLLYGKNVTINNVKSTINSAGYPIINSISTDGTFTSLSWQPPVGIDVKSYLLNVYTYTKKGWNKQSIKISGSEVRYKFKHDMDNSFLSIDAVSNSGVKVGVPESYTKYDPAPPEHPVSDEKAAVTSSEVHWSEKGIEVSVISNDNTRSWDLLIIDPYTGDIKNKYQVSGNTRTVLLPLNSPLRSLPLLVATGIGRNGVDKILLPYYYLSAKANGIGSDKLSLEGSITCIKAENIPCPEYSNQVGSEIMFYDEFDNYLGSGKLRDDGTFSTIIDFTGKEYSVKANSTVIGSSVLKYGSLILR